MVSSLLTIQQKIHVINLLDNGIDRKQIQQMFAIKPYHIKDIVKQKERILTYSKSGNDLNKYAIRDEYFPSVNVEVGQWLGRMVKIGVSIDAKAIKVKALQVAAQQGIGNFKASSGWITRLRKKYLNKATTDGKRKNLKRETNRQLTVKCANLSSVDEEVGSWLRRLVTQGTPFNYEMIKEKALQVAKKHGIDQFKASNCWIAKMKRRQLCAMDESNCIDKSTEVSLDVTRCPSPIHCHKESCLVDTSDQSNETVTAKSRSKCQLLHANGGEDKMNVDGKDNSIDTSNTSSKAKKIGYFPTIDARVGQWLEEMAEKGSSMNYKSIREKAIKVAHEQGIYNFKASDCWIWKMKKNCQTSSKRHVECPLDNLFTCQGLNSSSALNSNAHEGKCL